MKRAPHAIQRRRRGVERLESEVELAAIMRRKTEIAIRERVVAAVGQRFEAEEFAGRLRHLGVVGEKEVAMHPEIREPGAHARLGLRDLVRVMNRDVIFAAAVDVEEIAQVFLRHR